MYIVILFIVRNMECANCYLPNRDLPDLPKDKLIDFLKSKPTEFRFIATYFT